MMFDKLLERIKRVDEIECKLLSIFEGKSWEYIAKALYQILDDIDTADDMCRENAEAFRNVVMKLLAKKNQYLYSLDGYVVQKISEGFLELSHEVPGIDKRGREILQVGYEHNFISDITDMPGDKEPDLETMASDLIFHLNELAGFSKDVETKKKLRQLADYFEEREKDKGIIAGGYLQYLVIPLLIDSLKEKDLWDEQMNAPIFKLEANERCIKENFTAHARKELELAGMFDKEVDGSEAAGSWNILCAEAVMELMEVFAEQGHSGFSASMTQELFSRLSKFEPLTELTDNPGEWNDISEMQSGKPGWQNQRSSSCFSEDGGKTYWDISEEYYLREDEEDGMVYSGGLSGEEWANRPIHQSKHVEKEE